MNPKIHDFSEQINVKANEHIAELLAGKSDFSVKKLVEIRRAFMCGAIAVLKELQKVIENEKAGSDVNG